MTERTSEQGKRPVQPYLVLAVALILPGVGHLLVRLPSRGLIFLFFTLLFGWITYHLTTPDHSWVGRYAGGLFIYSISVLDAYKNARLRWERYKRGLPPNGD